MTSVAGKAERKNAAWRYYVGRVVGSDEWN